MTNPSKEDPKATANPAGGPRRGQGPLIIALVLLSAFALMFYISASQVSRIDYSFLEEQLERNNVQELTLYDSYAQGGSEHLLISLLPIMPKGYWCTQAGRGTQAGVRCSGPIRQQFPFCVVGPAQ